MRRMILPCVASLVPPHFSTLSYKRHGFQKKKPFNIKYVFRFSLQMLSETVLILKIIHRDIIINVKTSFCEVPLFLTDFNET